MRSASRIGLVIVATLAFACDEKRPPDLIPEGPGGGIGTSGPSPAAPEIDAGFADARGPTGLVRGNVCLVFDLSDPTACPPVDSGGFLVTELISGRSTVTAGDGSFSVEPMSGPGGAILEVSGPGVRTTLLRVPAGETDVIAPLVDIPTFELLLESLDLTEPPDTAAVLVQLRENEGPAVRARIIASGTAILYDTPLPPGFNALGPTGDFGTALAIGVPASTGVTSIQAVNDSVTVTRTVSDLPVREGALTFTTIDLTPR